MKKRDFVHWRPERNECGSYSWTIIENMVCVCTPNGKKCTQIGGSSPHHIARILAKELGAFNHCSDC